jgi:hypothetical protein
MSDFKIRRNFRGLGIALLILAQAWLPVPVVAQGSDQAEPAGLINSVAGEVYARRGSGEEVLLKAGDVFTPGTTFRSGAEGNVVLLFADGQNVTLGKDSTLRVDEYKFDARDPKSNRSSLTLVTGAMSFVSGAILTTNPQGLNVSMGEVRLGIVSKDVTAFTAEANARSTEPGFVAVTVGEVAVRTPSGNVTIASDQFVRVQQGAAPSLPLPLAAAPAVLQAAVAAGNATVIPSNNPIDVQSTAVQVALASLPTTAAGNTDQNQQAQSVQTASAAVVPSVSPGGGRGCVGSPC